MPPPLPPIPARASQRELVNLLREFPLWEKKIEVYNGFEYDTEAGVWVNKTGGTTHHDEPSDTTRAKIFSDYDKVNYGCGGTIMPGWLNADLFHSEQEDYHFVDLLAKHPFADNSIRLGFSEDVLEHLTQAESIFFLSEIHRAMQTGGVMRLSFPGLEGVLKQHYTPYSETRVREGEFEAYAFWDHIHFYSKEELRLVAEHIGFSKIEFVEYGKSTIPELSGLDTRENQIGLNTYAELTK